MTVKGTLYECQNCGSKWALDELEEIYHYYERVAEDEEEPAGQCPDCGCLCHEACK